MEKTENNFDELVAALTLAAKIIHDNLGTEIEEIESILTKVKEV